MLGLRELQAAFKRHLFEGDGGVADHIVSARGLDSEVRLAIYANAYGARLAEALETDYPALKALLGEAAFGVLCQAYVRAHPSAHPSLRWYGAGLTDFLRHDPAFGGRFYLGEISAFEWAFTEAFDGPNEPAADESVLSHVPPEAWPSVTVRLHPTVRRLHFEWNVIALWRTVKEGNPVPEPSRLGEPSDCLVWRQGLRTRYRTMDADEAAALTAVAEGAVFAAVCERLTDWMSPEQVPLRAASLLKTWLAAGQITALDWRGRATD